MDGSSDLFLIQDYRLNQKTQLLKNRIISIRNLTNQLMILHQSLDHLMDSSSSSSDLNLLIKDPIIIFISSTTIPDIIINQQHVRTLMRPHKLNISINIQAMNPYFRKLVIARTKYGVRITIIFAIFPIILFFILNLPISLRNIIRQLHREDSP